MRQIITILSISIIVLSACDKVENPIPKNSGQYDVSLYPGNYGAEYIYPEFSSSNNTVKNILIEDFTGHQCGNCPQAATVAKDLEEANPGRVFVASLHAGAGGFSNFQYFTTPDDNKYPKYSRDFTNDAGLTYAVDIQGMSGNPMGMINRVAPQGTNNKWIQISEWQNTTNTLLSNNDLKVNIQLEASYFEETSAIFTHVYSETRQPLEGEYNLIVYAVAKELIDWQTDYSVFPKDIEFYKHHNVHMGNVNGTWGDPIFNGTVDQGNAVRKDYTYKIPEKYQGLEYAIIAFVLNVDSGEIEQVVFKDAE